MSLRDPAAPVTPIPMWPGLAELVRTSQDGRWRTRSLNPSWTSPTLRVGVNEDDYVLLVHGPTPRGTGEASLGTGPASSNDDAIYDPEQEAGALAAWAASAAGAQVDVAMLRELLVP